MTFETIVNNIISIISTLVFLIIPAAVIVFLYGLFGYMTKGDDESKRKESLIYMITGIVGLFVMISFWGIVQMLTGTFGFSFGIPRIL